MSHLLRSYMYVLRTTCSGTAYLVLHYFDSGDSQWRTGHVQTNVASRRGVNGISSGAVTAVIRVGPETVKCYRDTSTGAVLVQQYRSVRV